MGTPATFTRQRGESAADIRLFVVSLYYATAVCVKSLKKGNTASSMDFCHQSSNEDRLPIYLQHLLHYAICKF